MDPTPLQIFEVLSAAIRVLYAHGLKEAGEAQTWPGDPEQQEALEELLVAVCQVLPPEELAREEKP